MNPDYRLIIFDLDGTLVDTMGGFADIAGDIVARTYRLPFEEARKKYLETSGVPFFQQLRILFPADPRNAEAARIFEAEKVAVFTRATISESTLETIHRLKDSGYRTAISSNNFHPLVREFVHRENVPVDVALGFRPGFSKGAPHFDYLADYFRLEKSEMLFVGDSLQDARIAQQNDISFVGKLGTFGERDFTAVANPHPIPTISEIHELISLLEEK